MQQLQPNIINLAWYKSSTLKYKFGFICRAWQNSFLHFGKYIEKRAGRQITIESGENKIIVENKKDLELAMDKL